jgi:hypothetical protein
LLLYLLCVATKRNMVRKNYSKVAWITTNEYLFTTWKLLLYYFWIHCFKRALVLSPRKIVESNDIRTTTAVGVSSLLIEKRFDVSWCLATGAPSLALPSLTKQPDAIPSGVVM